MSRIGKLPIQIPAGVTVEIANNLVTVKGSKGELKREIHHKIKVEVIDNQVVLSRPNDSKESKSLHGLSRTLVANMIEGVTKGYEKKLEIVGVGYRAKPANNKISLSLGFSHPVDFTAPKGIEFTEDPELKNVICVKGIDKELVGEIAAKIRSFKKPEPYKGKGIKYLGERIERKAGKAAASK